jgi:hypothetical protein
MLLLLLLLLLLQARLTLRQRAEQQLTKLQQIAMLRRRVMQQLQQ